MSTIVFEPLEMNTEGSSASSANADRKHDRQEEFKAALDSYLLRYWAHRPTVTDNPNPFREQLIASLAAHGLVGFGVNK
jgi:hypothetical protein